MPSLVWDEISNRMYESGVDKGVLYLPNGSGIPWNGLTSVVESSDKEVTPVYYDGMKINQLVTPGDFNGTLKALTYPDEFVELEGLVEIKTGVVVGNQNPKPFGLSYRTQIGNGEVGQAGYKLHILYNVTAIPSDKTYASISDTASPTEFEWTISAIPEEVPGIHPTSHLIFNSMSSDSAFLSDIEDILYGSETSISTLMPLLDLITYIKTWFKIRIIANGDGSWTAISKDDDLITMLTVDTFEIDHVTAVFLDEDTYAVTDTDSDLS